MGVFRSTNQAQPGMHVLPCWPGGLIVGIGMQCDNLSTAAKTGTLNDALSRLQPSLPRCEEGHGRYTMCNFESLCV